MSGGVQTRKNNEILHWGRSTTSTGVGGGVHIDIVESLTEYEQISAHYVFFNFYGL